MSIVQCTNFVACTWLAGYKNLPGSSWFTCQVQKLYSAATKFVSALTRSYYISSVQDANSLLRHFHPDQEGTKGKLTKKAYFCVMEKSKWSVPSLKFILETICNVDNLKRAFLDYRFNRFLSEQYVSRDKCHPWTWSNTLIKEQTNAWKIYWFHWLENLLKLTCIDYAPFKS